MSSRLHGIEREISDQSELYSNWWICHRDVSQLGENERSLFRKIINEAYHRGDCFCYFGHWMCQRIDEPEIQPGRARQPESGRENFERGVHQMEHRPNLQTVRRRWKRVRDTGGLAEAARNLQGCSVQAPRRQAQRKSYIRGSASKPERAGRARWYVRWY